MSKSFANTSLGIKELLSTENGTQYTNYQMNNSIKNQINPNISDNTVLWTDCMYDSLDVTKFYVAAIIRQQKWIDMQNN